MATRAECKKALDLHERVLEAIPDMVGLGIVPADDETTLDGVAEEASKDRPSRGTKSAGGKKRGKQPASMAIAIYVRHAVKKHDIPKHLEVPTKAGPKRVPVRVIEQGPVELEPGFG